MDGVFQRQQVSEVLAPLCRHHSALIQIVVEPCRAQIVLRGDAVQIKVRERPRPAVIVHDGERRAADRVSAAEAPGNALAEGRLARAKPAGKGDERQHFAEAVFKEVVLFKGAFKAFFDDPIAVIHGKPFAERENPHRAVGVQSAFCQKPIDVGAVAGNGAAAHPAADPFRRQLHIQRQKMPLIFVDPMHFDFGRAGIVGRGKTQKRNVILLQNKFHIAASLSLFF